MSVSLWTQQVRKEASHLALQVQRPYSAPAFHHFFQLLCCSEMCVSLALLVVIGRQPQDACPVSDQVAADVHEQKVGPSLAFFLKEREKSSPFIPSQRRAEGF